MGLISEIKTLKQEVAGLKEQLKKVNSDLNKRAKPESSVPLLSQSFGSPFPSTGTGLGSLSGKTSFIIWNNSDGSKPPWGIQPDEPTLGFNKHGHSRYAGGAIDINTLEFVEYTTDDSGIILDSEGNPLNKHCQSYWKFSPSVVLDENQHEKVGDISENMVWDKDANDGNGAWRFYAVYKDEDEEEDEEE